jgi:hypothetical protein
VQQHPSLAEACARALIAAARSEPTATRQQLRAAARRFVRRHRRDAGYLAWVLRSVSASSALAVALLGIAAEPASAQATAFTMRTPDPLVGQDVGLFSAPAQGDLDGDCDLDLISGARLGGLFYFENTGSATGAAYAARTGAANPLDAVDLGFFSAPALADLDGDGDLDVVAGEDLGSFFYFENTGNATSPAFVARTGAANPLDGQSTDQASAPAFGDLDADGDLDLVAGAYDGGLFYFENTGSPTSPAFVPLTGAASPFDGWDLGYYTSPALGDLDGDGDLDVAAGNANGDFPFLENTGSAMDPSFASLPNAANPLDMRVGSFSTPALGDLDGDGDLDLVAGEAAGSFASFENHLGDMIRRTGAANPLASLFSGAPSSLGDLDDDGDFDLVIAQFHSITNHIDEFAFREYLYYENTGSPTAPAWIRRTGAANPLDGYDVLGFTMPALVDLDDDGDLDLVAGTRYGIFIYYENTGSASSVAFVPRAGAANPLNGLNLGSENFTNPTFGDLDADGDLDLVSGERFFGLFRYLENTGSATSPAFVWRTGAANPLEGENVGSTSAPALGDVDADGDLDLVAGRYFGGLLFYYENTGSVASPAFIQRTGGANLFDGYLVSAADPSLVDLDGDGDLDVGVSRSFIENAIVEPSPVLLPEPATGSMLGAGAALLAWLGRWRGRRAPG